MSGLTALLLAGQRPGTDPLAAAFRHDAEGAGADRRRSDAVARRPHAGRSSGDRPRDRAGAGCRRRSPPIPIRRGWRSIRRSPSRRPASRSAARSSMRCGGIRAASRSSSPPPIIRCSMRRCSTPSSPPRAPPAPTSPSAWSRGACSRPPIPPTSAPGCAFAAALIRARTCSCSPPRPRSPRCELWRTIEQQRKKGRAVIGAFGPLILLGVALRLFTLHGALAPRRPPPRPHRRRDRDPDRRSLHRCRQARRSCAGERDPRPPRPR